MPTTVKVPRVAALAPRRADAPDRDADSRPYTVGFLLATDFPMMPFAAAIEPLRAANRLTGVRRFDWRLFSRDGEPVRASVVTDNFADMWTSALA